MSEKINIIIAAQTNAAVKGLDQVSKSTQRVGQSVQTAQSKMGSFNKSVTVGNTNMRKFAMGGMQQAGYQVGDFAVQVANGTSKMQAFGQQAPQLLQIFGPIGAVVGAAVAIFAAIGVAIQKSSVSARDASEAFSGLLSTMKGLESKQASLLAVATMIKKEFGESADVVQSLVDSLVELERIEVLKKLATGFEPINSELETAFGYIRQIEGLQSRITLTNPNNEARLTRLNNMLNIANDNLLNMGGSAEDITKIFNMIQSVMRETDPKKLVEGLSKIKAEAEEMDGLLGVKISRAITEAADSAGVLGSMLAEASASEKGRLAIAQELTRFMREEDTIMGQTVVKANGIHAVLKAILEDRDRIKKTLEDEDAVMGQIVAKSFVYAKNMFQGGRGSDPRLFTYIDEMRAQLEAAEAAAAKLNDNAPKGLSKIAAKVNSELSPAMKRLNDISESVGQSFENAMMSAVDGTKSVKSAFRSMAAEIIKELYRVFVVKQITGFITDAIGGMVGGGVTTSLRPRARPASFDGGGYTGSGARAGGLDGKGGFMAMLHPRETVTDHTRGQGGGQVVVNQTINVSTGVQQTVRTEIKQLMPQIAESAKSAVVDAKRRGGSYGRAFA